MDQDGENLQENVVVYESFFACDLCSKVLRNRKTLIEHIRKVHDMEPALCKGKIKCPADVNGTPCQFACSRYDKLRRHLDVDHSIKVQEEVFKFEDFKAFQRWKEAEEKKTKTLFVTYTSTKQLKNKRKYYFICHRSGNYMCKGRGLRKLKRTGSVKIGSCCPATMETEEDVYSGKVRVLYRKTHIGHDEKDQKHAMTVSKQLKRHITNQFTEGVPLDKVWNEVKTSLESSFPSRTVPSTIKEDLLELKKKCVTPERKLVKIAMKPSSVHHRLLIDRTEAFLEFVRENRFSEAVCITAIQDVDSLHRALFQDSEEIASRVRKEAENHAAVKPPKPRKKKKKSKKRRLILRQYVSPEKPILVQHSGPPPEVITLKHVLPPRPKSRAIQHFLAAKRKQATETVRHLARRPSLNARLPHPRTNPPQRSEESEESHVICNSDHMYACPLEDTEKIPT